MAKKVKAKVNVKSTPVCKATKPMPMMNRG